MAFRTMNRGVRCTLLCAALFGVSFSISAQPMHGGPRQLDMVIDSTQRNSIIDALIRQVTQKYVFPAQAKRVEQTLRQEQKGGAFDGITSAEQLAKKLTEELQRDTKDKHLQVRYTEQPLPEQSHDSKPSPEEIADELAQMQSRNFGVERIERLPFNIGYLSLRGFAAAKDAANTIAATMTVLANTDALILDLRKNGGGDAATVTMLASYFLDARTHLNTMYFRDGDRTEQLWSTEYVAGTKYGQRRDVYILTSNYTFSAAEDFSYTLQNLKRATVVGEVTGGGANPGEFVRIHPHFSVFVPNGRTINPITQTNWEGVGVAPDVKVPAADALATAQVAVLTKMASTQRDVRQVDAIQARMAEVKAGR